MPTDLWKLLAYNARTGEFWVQTKTISGSTDFIDSTLTSVFFENPNDSTEHWDSSYEGADPKINSAYAKTVSDGAWDYWEKEYNYVMNCDPGEDRWSDDASGSLSGPGVTYHISEIQKYCAEK